MDLEQQLRELVKLQIASPTAVGKAAGIDTSTMSRFMNGGQITLRKASALAEVLGVSLTQPTRMIQPIERGRPRKS